MQDSDNWHKSSQVNLKDSDPDDASTTTTTDSVSVYASTWSSNMTMSDIVGPGRLLGKFYARIGRAIEHVWQERVVQSNARSSPVIDRAIENDLRTGSFRRECKILLLGASGSGKSTIVKQMKIIHQNGYSPRERASYRHTVYKNLVDSAHALVLAMRKIGVDPVMASNRMNADVILDYTVPEAAEEGWVMSEEVALAIHQLWLDPIVPEVMGHTSEFRVYHLDSASYFLSEAIRIGSPTYIPTETDILYAYQETTGIIETRFNIGQLSIHMFDVGGRRSERWKWIHCFESVTSIIFCTALSEYDEVLIEEPAQNRMVESLVLFETIVKARWFLHTSIILFLNKIDVFESKLPNVPLEKYFPEYTGGSDVIKATKYILWKFMQANKDRLNVYPHLTQATDTSYVRLAFADIKETIQQNAINDLWIL